jgi:hypothetical protein
MENISERPHHPFNPPGSRFAIPHFQWLYVPAQKPTPGIPSDNSIITVAYIHKQCFCHGYVVCCFIGLQQLI